MLTRSRAIQSMTIFDDKSNQVNQYPSLLLGCRNGDVY
jgi:hypothetical protein